MQWRSGMLETFCHDKKGSLPRVSKDITDVHKGSQRLYKEQLGLLRCTKLLSSFFVTGTFRPMAERTI